MAIAGSLVVTVSARTSDFEAGMRKTTATLKFTEQQASQVSQAFGKLGDAFTATGSKASRASSAMQELKGNLLGLAAGVLSFQALRSAIEGSVQAALKLEALHTAFKVITGSATGAAEAMQFVRDTGERLGVQIDAISTGYKALLASTQGTSMRLKEAQTLFLGVVEGSRALGLSAEDTAGALRPLTQIISQQAFQADELRNELGSRLPGVMQMLVTASNGAFKSVGDLTKAMEDGKLKGQAALDLAANFGQVLRNKFAPAAMEAARGTQAAFDRLQTAVNDLAVAFGRSLAPALAEAARALTAFIQLGRDGAGAFGGQFMSVIREATSIVIGLTGAVIVLGKYLGALATLAVLDGRAFDEGWEDVKQTFSDIIALQQKVLSGGFGVQPGATMAAPGLNLKPFEPGGGEDKKAKKTAAEKEAERIVERQKDLIQDITDNLDVQNAIFERGITQEQARLELRIAAAKLGKADADTVLKAFEETQLLTKLNEDRANHLKEISQIQTTLQTALDKELYTEREILRQKLTTLEADATKIDQLLKLFDRQQAAEAKRKQDEKDREESLKAQADHMEKMLSLHKQLEPNIRYRSRREELVATQKAMVTEGANEYELAASDVQIATTLAIEEQQRLSAAIDNGLGRMADELASTFIDMASTGEFSFKRLADSFSRMTIEVLADVLDLKGAISGWLKQALGTTGQGGQAGSGLLGSIGGLFSSGGGSASTAALQTDISTSMATNPDLFAFGGGLAAGGPVMPNRYYTVGERGPETFIPGQPGTIVPNGGMGGVTVNMHISTPDVGGFRASERQIWAAAMRQGQQARRVL